MHEQTWSLAGGWVSDEGKEDNSFEKDMANDELTIVDYSHFYSQYGKWLKPDTNPVWTGQGSRVAEENLLTSFDEGHTHHRQKRQVTESPQTTDLFISGDGTCLAALSGVSFVLLEKLCCDSLSVMWIIF